ncbi:MAG: tol-pal system protein YbgF [Proteobacteria bacterium]|nr:tol-pal system protein YbgF [Pseudomonadota bacterium]
MYLKYLKEIQSGLLRRKAPRNDGRMRALLSFVFATSILTTSLHAEDNPALLVDLINRVGAIEAENRELRGQLEEARHEVSQLTQRMETLSADVDYRLSNPDSGGANSTQASLSPSSVATDAKPVTEAAPPASSSKEAYEKARSLLEQGDYAAAEHAFAAFVSAYSKDELAGAAQYWLGVTFFVRGEHEKATAAFAKGYKNYPKSSKAADNLLKLAKSLGALDRKSDACTALDQLAAEHSKFSRSDEVSTLRKNYSCKG